MIAIGTAAAERGRIQGVGARLMERGWEWTKRLSGVGGAQIIAQGLGFVSGILIVRMLAPQQYALYTLANTMLGTMKVLADSGISSGMLSEGGKVWQNRRDLGAVIVTGMAMRRRFAIWSMVVSVPVLLYLLRSHGDSWIGALVMLGAVAAYFWALLDWDIFGIAPSLHQRVAAMQRIGVVQSLGRLLGLVAMLAAVPWAVVAIAVAALPQFWASKRLQVMSFEVADLRQVENAGVRIGVTRVVRRVLPAAIYFCLSSQITIWLVSVLGSTLALAKLGALSRLGQIFTVFSAIAAAVIVPRFARLRSDRGLVLRRYFQVLALLAISGAAITAVFAARPREILWLLGPEYADLVHEVVLLVIGSAMNLLAGTAYLLGNARGHVTQPVISISLQVLCQIWLISRLDVSTLDGVLWFGIWMPAFQLLVYSVSLFHQTRRAAP